jgi:hypothetical protein
MSEQNLDDTDVHASLEHMRGEAVTERVRPEVVVEMALVSRLVESIPRGGVRKVGDDAATGEQPPWAAVRFPDLSQHLQD